MALDFVDGFGDRATYSYNGGDWFLSLDKKSQIYYSDLFRKLPITMEVQIAESKVGIVHAECLLEDWNDFKNLSIQYNNNALWGRHRIRNGDKTIVKNIDKIYVGHTHMRKPFDLGNHIYMDTGVVFGNGEFIIQRIN